MLRQPGADDTQGAEEEMNKGKKAEGKTKKREPMRHKARKPTKARGECQGECTMSIDLRGLYSLCSASVQLEREAWNDNLKANYDELKARLQSLDVKVADLGR